MLVVEFSEEVLFLSQKGRCRGLGPAKAYVHFLLKKIYIRETKVAFESYLRMTLETENRGPGAEYQQLPL